MKKHYILKLDSCEGDGKPRRPKYLIPHKMKEFLRIYEQTQDVDPRLETGH